MTRMQAVRQVLLGLIGKLLVGVSWFVTRVFGIFEWHPPAWISHLAAIVPKIAEPCRATVRYLNADPKRPVALALASSLLLGG